MSLSSIWTMPASVVSCVSKLARRPSRNERRGVAGELEIRRRRSVREPGEQHDPDRQRAIRDGDRCRRDGRVPPLRSPFSCQRPRGPSRLKSKRRPPEAARSKLPVDLAESRPLAPARIDEDEARIRHPRPVEGTDDAARLENEVEQRPERERDDGRAIRRAARAVVRGAAGRRRGHRLRLAAFGGDEGQAAVAVEGGADLEIAELDRARLQRAGQERLRIDADDGGGRAQHKVRRRGCGPRAPRSEARRTRPRARAPSPSARRSSRGRSARRSKSATRSDRPSKVSGAALRRR